MKRLLSIKLSVLAMSLLLPLLSACQRPAQQPESLVLRFHPFVGEQPLKFNSAAYPNPGGAGHFSIRDFQFFISNVEVIGEQGSYQQPESYHLARFDNPQNVYEIVVTLPDNLSVKQLQLGIGVDPEANGTLTIAGDLDPNNRMAWSWDVGYKFILLEGSFSNPETQRPLVYHVGFDANYTEVQFAGERFLHDASVIHFKVDLAQLFTAQDAIDMAELSTVKFDRTDAARISAGFKSLISLCAQSCD